MSVHTGRLGAIALVVGLPALVVLLGALIPGSIDDKLTLLLRGICAQRPAHSYMADGRPVALEARMFGIFVGFAVAVGCAWLAGRSRRSELPGRSGSIFFTTCVLAMGLDGVNAVLFDLGAPYLYRPTLELRLLTGLLCGLAMAAFIAPVVSFTFFRERDPRPLFRSWLDFGVSAIPVAGVGVISAVGGAPGPVLSGLAALSVVTAFWLVNTYLCVWAWAGVGKATSWGDLAPSAVVGFVMTGAGLVGLSALRGWVEATLGLSWAV